MPLQEVAVAGRALGVQLEVLDAPIFQDNQLDVLAANVHDDVRVLVELHGRLGVGHGLHQRDIGLEHVLQHVLGIAGRADAQNFQRCTLRLHLLAERDEHVDGVLDRIAPRKLVRLAQHVALFGEKNSLGRGRTAIQSNESAHGFTDAKLCADEFRDRVLLLELCQLLIGGAKARRAGLRLFGLAADSNVILEALGAHVDADFGLFVLAELNRAERGEILRVVRNLDQIFEGSLLREVGLCAPPRCEGCSAARPLSCRG